MARSPSTVGSHWKSSTRRGGRERESLDSIRVKKDAAAPYVADADNCNADWPEFSVDRGQTRRKTAKKKHAGTAAAVDANASACSLIESTFSRSAGPARPRQHFSLLFFYFFFNFLLRKRRRKAKRLFSIFLLSTSRACLWGRRRVIQYNGKVDVKKLDEKMRKEVKLHSFTGRRRRRLRTRRINKVRQDNFFLFLTPPPFVVKMSLRNLGDGFSPMSAAVPVSHLSVASL